MIPECDGHMDGFAIAYTALTKLCNKTKSTTKEESVTFTTEN